MPTDETNSLEDQYSDIEAGVKLNEMERQMSRDTYTANKGAVVGSTIPCPTCGKQFKKLAYRHAFCRNRGRANCKDRFWNSSSLKRRTRAMALSRRGLGEEEWRHNRNCEE